MKPSKKPYLQDTPDEMIKDYRALLQKMQEMIDGHTTFFEREIARSEDARLNKLAILEICGKAMTNQLHDLTVDAYSVASRAHDEMERILKEICH